MGRTAGFVFFSVLIAAGAPFVLSCRRAIVQPINYNHNLHVEKNGLGCIDCHKNVETDVRAGIPNIEVCGSCHQEPIAGSEEEKKLISFVKTNKPIPWFSIYQLPGHAYFSHRRHVKIGKIECAECHGNVASLTSPPQKQFLSLTMENCINCHQKRGVSSDCYVCHR